MTMYVVCDRIGLEGMEEGPEREYPGELSVCSLSSVEVIIITEDGPSKVLNLGDRWMVVRPTWAS